MLPSELKFLHIYMFLKVGIVYIDMTISKSKWLTWI